MRTLIGFITGLVLIFGVFLLATGPAAPPEPAESAQAFYDRYRQTVLAGRSFGDEASFYSAAKQAEVDAQLARMGDDAEAAKAMYLDLTARQMACSEMTLAEKREEAGVVWLTYDVVDLCGAAGGARVTEVIGLTREDSWKIVSNETRIEQ